MPTIDRLFGARLANQKLEVFSVIRSKKAVFLELRQEYLAMGCFVRSHTDFHLFDPKKLV